MLICIYILTGFYENEFVIEHQTFHTFRAQAHKDHNYFLKTFFQLRIMLLFSANATVALKEI